MVEVLPVAPADGYRLARLVVGEHEIAGLAVAHRRAPALAEVQTTRGRQRIGGVGRGPPDVRREAYGAARIGQQFDALEAEVQPFVDRLGGLHKAAPLVGRDEMHRIRLADGTAGSLCHHVDALMVGRGLPQAHEPVGAGRGVSEAFGRARRARQAGDLLGVDRGKRIRKAQAGVVRIFVVGHRQRGIEPELDVPDHGRQFEAVLGAEVLLGVERRDTPLVGELVEVAPAVVHPGGRYEIRHRQVRRGVDVVFWNRPAVDGVACHRQHGLAGGVDECALHAENVGAGLGEVGPGGPEIGRHAGVRDYDVVKNHVCIGVRKIPIVAVDAHAAYPEADGHADVEIDVDPVELAGRSRAARLDRKAKLSVERLWIEKRIAACDPDHVALARLPGGRIEVFVGHGCAVRRIRRVLDDYLVGVGVALRIVIVVDVVVPAVNCVEIDRADAVFVAWRIDDRTGRVEHQELTGVGAALYGCGAIRHFARGARPGQVVLVVRKPRAARREGVAVTAADELPQLVGDGFVAADGPHYGVCAAHDVHGGR